MPVQVIVGERKLKENKVEVKIRKSGERFDVELDSLIDRVKKMLE
jgi:prolyl-tRNA synthetase